ncbi:hypothetical protein [Enterobacter mori]
MTRLTPDDIADLKEMLRHSTVQELSLIATLLKYSPEHIVTKLSEAERKKGFKHYDSLVRALDYIDVINEFLKPLRPMLG